MMMHTSLPRRSEHLFWRSGLALLSTILVLILIVIFRGSTVSLGVTTTPPAGAVVSGRSRIVLTFPTAMATASVESHLRLDPAVTRRWSWEANGGRSDRVAQFLPNQLFTPGVAYRATLARGARALNGRTVMHDTA